jgi:hypothetical protein
MGKNVIPFRCRKGVTDSEEVANRGLQIIVRVRRRRYAGDMSCAATTLVAEADPAANCPPRVLQVEGQVGDQVPATAPAGEGGRPYRGVASRLALGWDKERPFDVVMVERVVHGPNHLPLD